MAQNDAIDDVKAKSKDFVERAKSGNLDEGTLKWGLSAGAVVAGVSLLFNYASWDFGMGRVGVSGLDLLNLSGGISFGKLECLAIPLSAFMGLYLHFGESKFKVLKMDEPGRAKTVYLVGMIVAALGTIGCIHFILNQICFGNLLGLTGLALLAFVYFKLWRIHSAAPAEATPPVTPAS